MDTLNSPVCHGCLTTDRKLCPILDQDKILLFKYIMNEIAPPVDQLKLSVCWECSSHLNKFIKFKTKVKECYRWFAMNTNSPKIPKEQTLKVIKQENIDLIPETDDLNNADSLNNLELEYPKPEIKKEIISNEDYLDHYSESELSTKEVEKEEKVTKKVKNKSDRSIKKKKKRPKSSNQHYKEVELTDAEIEKERNDLRMQEDYLIAMFKCDLCILPFPNKYDLKEHVEMKHELNAAKHKCSICSCSFSSEISLNYHWNRHRKRFQCLTCDQLFTSPKKVSKHNEFYHAVQCNMSKDGNGQHTDKQTDRQSFPCPMCAKVFKWKTSLRKHSETHRIQTGLKRRPYCETCSMSFTTTSNLQKHVKTSSKHQIQLKLRKLKEENPQTIDNRKPDQSVIDKIKSSINSAKSAYPCQHCSKRFQWRGNLLRHLQSHADRAKGGLFCEPCNRSFSSIATFKQHMAISKRHVTESDYQYVCSDCGKRFANKTRLTDHIHWEHLKKYIHNCELCQKSFKSHTSLYLHTQVVHKKNCTQHLCDHCGKAFANHAKLRCHMLALHSAEAPYKCSMCSSRFSWHSCLSRHIRTMHKNKAKDWDR